MKNFILGLIIGIGKVLPGVSGSVIAIRFNLYEKMIDSILNFFKDIKKNFFFLFPIGLGIIIAILLMSQMILYLLDKYYFETLIIFAILILSGIKEIIIKSNNYFISIITFFISLLLLNIPFKLNIGYFLIGLIEAISIIVPGISGTAIYMSLGVYEKVLLLYTTFNIKNIFMFFIGFLISSFFIIKIINYLFLHYKKETYSAILGFLVSSILLMFI